jgi:GLPGLI family protein
MMKRVYALIIFCIWGSGFAAQAQKLLSEGTIVYDITVSTGATEPQMADLFDGATTTVYLKGNQSRTDMVSSLGKESTIYDARAGNAVILKEYSGQKLMITLTKENWAEKNKKYDEITFTTTSETKKIAGYNCKKAIAKLKDGSTFNVFYTTDITIANKEYDITFRNLPGLAMEYEMEFGKMKITYTTSKVSFEAVQASRFDFPKSGYRVMTYDENQKLKAGVPPLP